MQVLVDSSVWIDYFRSGNLTSKVDELIDQNVICTNNLILTELIPFLKIQNQTRIIKLLYDVTNINLNINWQKLIVYQTTCIKNGINKIGIPDFIIVDNAIQNDLVLYTLDQHFDLINKFIDFKKLE